MNIGLISDTHGLLRIEALRALSGVDQIIHAGDVGGPEVLERLRSLAPVQAVRGNNDEGAWAESLPLRLALCLDGVHIQVLHDVKELGRDPAAAAVAAGFQVVVAGHSHKPAIVERDGVLLVNPGSAGPRRFKLPVTIGILTVASGTPRAAIRELI